MPWRFQILTFSIIEGHPFTSPILSSFDTTIRVTLEKMTTSKRLCITQSDKTRITLARQQEVSLSTVDTNKSHKTTCKKEIGLPLTSSTLLHMFIAFLHSYQRPHQLNWEIAEGSVRMNLAKNSTIRTKTRIFGWIKIELARLNCLKILTCSRLLGREEASSTIKDLQEKTGMSQKSKAKYRALCTITKWTK